MLKNNDCGVYGVTKYVQCSLFGIIKLDEQEA